MPVQDAPLGQALGPRRDHILAANLFEHHVLGQQCGDGKAARHQADERQRQMPEIIHHLAEQAQRRPVIGGQATQRKPRQERATAKQHQQCHPQHEARNGIAHQNGRGGPEIEAAAIAHRLGNAQRNGHQIDDQKAPYPETDGNRQLLQDQRAHRLLVAEALAQVEAQIAPHHLDEARGGRFVETVESLYFCQLPRIHPLCPPIAWGAGRRCHLAALPAAAQALHHLLHRAARHELDDHEAHQQDAQQRGNHQRQPAQYVTRHDHSSGGCGLASGSNHQVCSIQDCAS